MLEFQSSAIAWLANTGPAFEAGFLVGFIGALIVYAIKRTRRRRDGRSVK